MFNITNGKKKRPQRVVIYGPEGIGKTTFAASFPKPFFIDTEQGTDHLDVFRAELPDKWDDLILLVEQVCEMDDVCETLVIDTADRAEDLCIKNVCAKFKKDGIEEFGYGKGYVYVYEEFSRLLAACDKVIESGKNVVITAHAAMRKFEQPDELGAYDRWELKLSKKVAPLVKEWADMVLFCNYKTYVVKDATGTNKGQGGKRVVYTSHHPCWDAKNRQGLPPELPLDIKEFGDIFNMTKKSEPKPEPPEIVDTPQNVLKNRLRAEEVAEDQLKKLVVAKGHFGPDVEVADYPDAFLMRWVFPNWEQIIKAIKK